ncbi:hypothetical protein AD428_10945 [Achromobacter sp. DMS1]|nr:hypothetical protein AD428_10945 [Achromobacter sp. DMS1]
MTSNKYLEVLTPQNSQIIFIDQQPQMAFGVQSIDRQTLKNNVVGLAKAAKVFNIPTTITTVETDSFSGNTYPELLAVFPDHKILERTSMNSWDDQNVRDSQVEEVHVPFDFHGLMLSNGRIIAAEAYALHRAYIEDPAQPFGPYVRQRILAGKALSAADYLAAMEEHARTRQAWKDWMAATDALLTPALPFEACLLEEVDEAATPLAAFRRAGNFLGACGLALPAGFGAHGMPVGIQLLGKPYDDGLLCRIGIAFQHATDWHLRHPDLRGLAA